MGQRRFLHTQWVPAPQPLRRFFARYCTLAPCWLSVWRHRLSVSSVAPSPARSFSVPHVRTAADALAADLFLREENPRHVGDVPGTNSSLLRVDVSNPGISVMSMAIFEFSEGQLGRASRSPSSSLDCLLITTTPTWGFNRPKGAEIQRSTPHPPAYCENKRIVPSAYLHTADCKSRGCIVT